MKQMYYKMASCCLLKNDGGGLASGLNLCSICPNVEKLCKTLYFLPYNISLDLYGAKP